MRYTIIYTDAEGNWKTLSVISSHDKDVAWDDVQQYLDVSDKIQLLTPGEQIVYLKQKEEVVML
jgi:hypothetical protein|tara:strand:+ start:982 stop:1173 length:192 start_codon:yes stop_codon:yes gene_type:complete